MAIMITENQTIIFWSRVDKSGECWLWTGHTRKGYGHWHFKVSGSSVNKNVVPHRIAYELIKGPIPHGLVLDHLCRNRLCVNPGHLEIVTQRVNVLRGNGLAAQNALKTHCPKGHAFTPENTLILPGRKKRHRLCRECNRIRCIADYYRKKKTGSYATVK